MINDKFLVICVFFINFAFYKAILGLPDIRIIKFIINN